MAKRDTEIYNTKTKKWMSREDLEEQSKKNQQSDKEKVNPKKLNEDSVSAKEDNAVEKILRNKLNKTDDEKEKKRLETRFKLLQQMGRGK